MKIYPLRSDKLKLLIEMDNHERAELQEELLTFPEKSHDIEMLVHHILEPAIAYGYVYVCPEDTPYITDSPILQVESDTTLQYYFKRFDEVSPLDDLLNLGFCVFHHVSLAEKL